MNESLKVTVKDYYFPRADGWVSRYRMIGGEVVEYEPECIDQRHLLTMGWVPPTTREESD